MQQIVFALHQSADRLRPEDCPDAETLRQWHQRGAEISYVPWQAQIKWQQFTGILLRTVYGYDAAAGEFAAWLRQAAAAGARFVNSAQTVHWNLDKGYLRHLEAAGFPVIPTRWLNQGERVDLKALHRQTGWSHAVLKPTISAGARNSWHCHQDRVADQHRLDALLLQSDMMMQPFLPSLIEQGEWSAVYFHGQFSHSLLKRPRHGDWRVQEEHGGTHCGAPMPEAALDVTERIIQWLAPTPAYARIDGVLTPSGFMLMEVELIEPYLYLHTHPDASRHYWQALTAALLA